MTTVTPLDPSVVPEMDWPFVTFAREQVKLAEERGDNTVWAWLFADGATVHRRLWVKVPLMPGIKRATEIDEVDVDLWMDAGRGASDATFDLADHSFQVDRYPLDALNDLAHSFTFVFSSQNTAGEAVHPINHLINTLVPGLNPPWRGNVLVFRHGSTHKKVIVNIEERYGEAVCWLISTLFREHVRDGLI